MPSKTFERGTVLFLAGDIGGTNSRMQLYATRPVGKANRIVTDAEIDMGAASTEELIGEYTYPSTKHASLEECITQFLATFNPQKYPLYCMALAVAGPVADNAAKITNLQWEINGASLARNFDVEHVRIMNDFVGIGYGLLALKPNELETVYDGKGAVPAVHGVKAVIGAGTGLGECFLTFNGKEFDVYPAEGGHTDFAPRNQTEFDILQYCLANLKNDGVPIDRVSVERVTSGTGMRNIYNCLAAKFPGKADKAVAEKIKAQSDDVGKIIAEGATGHCPICVQVMDIFAQTYGAETGNLALKTLPTGGIFIAGGIAAKNMRTLRKNDQYVQAYLQKGRMRTLLEKIPIYLITHKDVGLLGSKVICRRVIHAAANTKIVSKL